MGKRRAVKWAGQALIVLASGCSSEGFDAARAAPPVGAAGAAGDAGSSGAGSSAGGAGGTGGGAFALGGTAAACCPKTGPAPDCGLGALCRGPSDWFCIDRAGAVGPGTGGVRACVLTNSESGAVLCNPDLSLVGDWDTGKNCCAALCAAAGVQ